MDLSFIIPTYNGAARLPETLAHLAAQANRGGWAWEVLVVDNASTDGTAEVAREWAGRIPVELRVIAEPTPGQRHAIHRGLREARGRYFTLVDDDNHLCAEWLDEAVGFLDGHPRAGLVGGKVEPDFEVGAVIPADFEQRYKGYLALRDLGETPKVGVLPIGAGMTGRTYLMRAMYERVGGMQAGRVGTGLGSSEDLEKGKMLEHLGWEAWYLPQLSMKHWIPKGRLTEQYIDRMWMGVGEGIPWMRILERRGPVDPAGILAEAEGDRRLMRWEGWLCMLPGWVHPRVRRARFWRGYYAARVAAYEELARRAGEVKRVLGTLEELARELSPRPEAVEGARR